MTRRCIALLAVCGLAACTHEPIEYIPLDDRALLQAQARLGQAPGQSAGAIPVDEMLRRARAAGDTSDASDPAPATPSRLVLQFKGDAVQPDAEQKKALSGFASSMQGRSVTVLSRPGGFDGATALLGQRRALAVAHELSAAMPDVDLKFTPDAPADVVIVSAAGAAP